MSHLHDRSAADAPASMFTPSVARIAAKEARDWPFIDSWVAAQFPSRLPPPFERNADTLEALLTLIAFSNAASEEAHLVARVDQGALEELPWGTGSAGTIVSVSSSTTRDSLLHVVEQQLPREGRAALDSMSSMALSAKVSLPEPEKLGTATVDTQSAIFAAEQMAYRVEFLERSIHSDIAHSNDVLKTLQNEIDNLPECLCKRNSELQLVVKAMTANLPQFKSRVASQKSSSASSNFTVNDVLQEEEDYITLLENRKELESRISVFRGIPSDLDSARDELDAYRKELQGITSRRDAAFQGLVERGTPAKRR